MTEADHAVYDVRTAAPVAGIGARPAPGPAAREAREDKPFYVPDDRIGDDHKAGPETRAACHELAKDLKGAQALLDQIQNLVGVLRASLGDEDHDRAMQAETMLDVIGTKLSETRDRLDRHAACHKNLFLAYLLR